MKRQDHEHGQHQNQLQHQQHRRPSWFVIKLTLTASIGGIIFGFDLGAISGCLPQLIASEQFALTASESEWVVSVLYVGGGVGAAIGGTVCDVFGRKTTIIITDVVFMVGAAILYFSQTTQSIVFGRFIVGIGIAISGVADVSYLHECSPAQWRGAVVSCNEACISLGFLLAYLAGYIYNDNDGWRTIFGLAGVVAFVQLVGMIPLPESPAWLIEKGRIHEAELAWIEINGTAPNVDLSSMTTVLQSHSNTIELDTTYGSNNENNSSKASTTDQKKTAADRSKRKRGLRKRRSEDDTVQEQLNNRSLSTSTTDSNMGPVISHIRVDELQDDTTKFGGYLMGDGYQRANDSFDVDPTMPGQSQSSAYEWKNIKHSFQTLVSTISRYRRQCYISLYLAIVQQFCGQTNVLSYAPLIFAAAAKQDVDVDDTDSAAAVSRSTISIGLVKFVVTVLVICRIERIGRRKLLLAGTSLIVLGLFLLSVAFSGSNRSAGADHSDGTGTYESGANEGGSDSSWSPIKNMKTFHLALPGVLLVVSGYSMSFGPLTWLLTSELFPTDIRGRALGLSTVITYMAAALATRTFLSAQSWMGPSMLFGSYCAITSLGVMFEYLAIPDTGKMNSEQIEQSLNEMIWWKMGTNGGDDPSLEGHPSSLEMGSQLSLHSLT